MPQSLIRLLTALFATALVAASCSVDTDDEVIPEGEADATDTPAAVEVGSGVTIDLDACPDDWAATQGIDGDEIRIGISLPQSGSFAAFGAVADGIEAYFNYVNETDPIAGKDLVLIARDDAFEAGRSVANVEEMLEVDDIFAFFSVVGTANNSAVRPILNDACVPQLFSATGAPMFGDPVNFPWTIGGTLAYNTEASLWCQNIADELGEGTTVAGLFMNNDFGSAYQQSVEACAEAGTIELVGNEVHEGGAPTIANALTTLAATDADVFILGSTGAPCSESVATIAQSPWRPAFYMSNTCSNLASFFAPVQDAAVTLANDGSAVRMVSNTKEFSDPALADDPAIALGLEVLAAAGMDAAGSQSTGVQFAYGIVEALRAAVEIGGDLDRISLMQSIWNLDYVNPYLLDGVTVQTDGVNDAYVLEAARVLEIVPSDDFLTFNPISELISREGTTGSFSN